MTQEEHVPTRADLINMLERCAHKLENASAELSDPRDSDEEFQELAREVRALVKAERERMGEKPA